MKYNYTIKSRCTRLKAHHAKLCVVVAAYSTRSPGRSRNRSQRRSWSRSRSQKRRRSRQAIWTYKIFPTKELITQRKITTNHFRCLAAYTTSDCSTTPRCWRGGPVGKRLQKQSVPCETALVKITRDMPEKRAAHIYIYIFCVLFLFLSSKLLTSNKRRGHCILLGVECAVDALGCHS